jgi:hypothetical protein
MAYPLYDCGYTLWAADLESRLKDMYDLSLRSLAIEDRQLLHSYYGGDSVPAAFDRLINRYGLESAH